MFFILVCSFFSFLRIMGFFPGHCQPHCMERLWPGTCALGCRDELARSPWHESAATALLALALFSTALLTALWSSSLCLHIEDICRLLRVGSSQKIKKLRIWVLCKGFGLVVQLEHIFLCESLNVQPKGIQYFCLLKKTHYYASLVFPVVQYLTNEEQKVQVPPNEWLRLRATGTTDELTMKDDQRTRMLCFLLDFLVPTEQIIFSSQLLISKLKPKKHWGRVITV